MAISCEEQIPWEYHPENPNKCSTPNLYQPTVLPAPLYEWTPSVDPPKSGEVLHHMCDSGESPDVSTCHILSVAQTVHPNVSDMTHLSVSQIVIPPGSPYICQ